MTPDTAYPGMRLLLRIEENLDNYNEWIVEAFVAGAAGRLTAQAKVLDFGCGIGTLSRKFAARTGLAPDGVELDAVQRDMCRGRGLRCHP